MALVARRLPGVHVDVAPPAPVEALPRMDVAVFVGFASTGPLHMPVALESVAHFATVFGPDAPLAWDESRGERVLAYLGPAVRAFFANGGRRCWVIRVARTTQLETTLQMVDPPRLGDRAGVASSNVYSIPGVLSLPAQGSTVEPASAQARCEGSWSDGLRVSTALAKQGFAIEQVRAASSPASARLGFRSRFGLRPGDLIELADTRGIIAYAVIETVLAARESGGAYEIESTVCAAFERLAQAGSSPSGMTRSGEARISGFGEGLAATLSAPRDAPEPTHLRFDAPVPASVERGHWARWSDGADIIWMRMDEIERQAAFVGSPPEMSSSSILISATGPAWRELTIGDVVPVNETIRGAHRLTLELRVASGMDVTRLPALGLTLGHPSAWWNQSNDAEFYGSTSDAGVGRAAQRLPAELARFPLAPAAAPDPRAWLPLGVEPLFGAALAPLPQRYSALERDGLSAIGADLFLDPELAGTPMHAVSDLADAIRYLRPDHRSLFGIHAAASIGAGGLFSEVSLLAVPDAVHLGWTLRPDGFIGRANPEDPPTPSHWRTHRGPCEPADSSPLDGPDFGAFLDCETHALHAPDLRGPGVPVAPGGYRLSWSVAEQGAEFALIEATQTDFSDAREIYRGGDTEYVALAEREGVYYYRLFVRVGDERSAGSNVITVQVRQDAWVQQSADIAEQTMEGDWLAVHRAALRFAGSTGELFAVLTMPRHFRTEQALRYAQRLRAVREPQADVDATALAFTEARSLSYGALYFPWLQSGLAGGVSNPSLAPATGSSGRAARIVPADGAAAGVLAARASERGAWIAPANEPMMDVVAITPLIPEADWQALQDAQINLLRFDPRGLFTLSSDTLALESEVRPINVRRLLILLRRLALRRGTTFVFEPNGPTLRRAVQRSFGDLLTDLFRRGAFAGATPAQSFRVVTDSTINTAHDAESGRFFVELRVAPAMPMRFLTVRLAQTGERLTVVEEL